MENSYCVYCHTSPSGKRYIGITSKNPLKRWCCGYGYKYNSYFWNAIQKYGWDSFEHKILRTGLTREEASSLEKQLIAKYKTTNARYGYNFALGGFGGGHPLSEETKRKISEANRGIPCTDEKKKKLSEINKGKIPTNLEAIHAKNMKPVDKFSKDGEYLATYPSVRIAGEKCNVREASIGNCCRGLYKSAGGFVWRFSE